MAKYFWFGCVTLLACGVTMLLMALFPESQVLWVLVIIAMPFLMIFGAIMRAEWKREYSDHVKRLGIWKKDSEPSEYKRPRFKAPKR